MRQTYQGQPASAGVAVGPLRRIDRPPPVDRHADSPDTARAMTVDEAFAATAADLVALADQLRQAGQAESADIVDTNRFIAEDPDLRAEVDAGIAAGKPPETAIADAVNHHAELLAALPDPTLAARAADVRAVGRRLIAHLRAEQTGHGHTAVQTGRSHPAVQTGRSHTAGQTGQGHTAGHEVAGGARDAPGPGGDGGAPQIVAAYEITADDLLTAGARLGGALSVLGGAAAHAAIVARALGVPLVVGLDPAVLDEPDGTDVLLDGAAGTVVVAPDAAERNQASRAATAERERRSRLAAERGEPSRTRDGREVTVLANVGSLVEAELAREAGAEGVGLLRTEMPFLTASHWPTEDEQVAALAPVLKRFGGRPVTVRTFDFGADKLPPFLGTEHPRGLLPAPALTAQFRAVLRAAGEASVRIMVPMVSTVDELVTARGLLASAGGGGTPLGAMVETPEALAVIDELAAAADFLSIGSNDLTAALLDLDRRDPALTPARAADPVVLDAIGAVLRAGAAAGTPVSICGDAAADPAVLPLLVDLGCRALSVAPAALDEVRAQIRTI